MSYLTEQVTTTWVVVIVAGLIEGHYYSSIPLNNGVVGWARFNTRCMHIQDNDTERNLSTVSEPSEMKQNLVD